MPFTPHPHKEWWFYRQFSEDGQTWREASSPNGLDASRPIERFWHKEYSCVELIALLQEAGFAVRRVALCRFDLSRLHRLLPALACIVLRPLSQDRRTLKPAWDRLACALLPSWSKTCLAVAEVV